MKKKIASVIILSMYFFGGFGMVFGTTFDPAIEIPEGTPKAPDAYDSLKASGAGGGVEKDGGTIGGTTNSPGSTSAGGGGSDGGGATTVTVTEKIPGMKCDPDGDESDITKRKYKCTIQPGFGSVMLILKGLIKYATFITALIGVLMLVVSGIQYSISGADKDAAGHAKTRIQKVLAGIVLLFLIGFILNSVAPWVYR